MLGGVVRGEADRAAEAGSLSADGHGPVRVHGRDCPAVAVAHPSGAAGAEMAVVLAGDDEVTGAGLRAIAQGHGPVGVRLAGHDPVDPGAHVQGGDGLDGLGDEDAAPARDRVGSPGEVGAFQDVVVVASDDPVVGVVAGDGVMVAEAQLQGRGLLPGVAKPSHVEQFWGLLEVAGEHAQRSPASTAPSWAQSPTRTSLAPARSAWAASRSNAIVPDNDASSTIIS